MTRVEVSTEEGGGASLEQERMSETWEMLCSSSKKTLCACRSTEKRKKKHQVEPVWGSVTHQVLTDRGLLSIYRSTSPAMCPFLYEMQPQQTLLWLLFLLSLHRLFASTFVVDQSHSTRWRWHLSCKGHWLGPILSGRHQKNHGQEKGLQKKKEEKGPFSLE